MKEDILLNKERNKERNIYKRFGLVICFNDISTLDGYLMPNPYYTYTYCICDLLVNSLKLTLFQNESELIYLHTVKWFQLLLFNLNNSINVIIFLYTLRMVSSIVNGFKYSK